MDAPSELGGKEYKIGSLITTSVMTTSKFGDAGLFFRHQDMAEDLEIKPEWAPYTPGYKTKASNDLVKEVVEQGAAKIASGCPFSYLW